MAKLKGLEAHFKFGSDRTIMHPMLQAPVKEAICIHIELMNIAPHDWFSELWFANKYLCPTQNLIFLLQKYRVNWPNSFVWFQIEINPKLSSHNLEWCFFSFFKIWSSDSDFNVSWSSVLAKSKKYWSHPNRDQLFWVTWKKKECALANFAPR